MFLLHGASPALYEESPEQEAGHRPIVTPKYETSRLIAYSRLLAAVLMTAVSRRLSPSASRACVRARYRRNGESWWHPAHLLLIIRQLRRRMVAPVVAPMPSPALTPEPVKRHGLWEKSHGLSWKNIGVKFLPEAVAWCDHWCSQWCDHLWKILFWKSVS